MGQVQHIQVSTDETKMMSQVTEIKAERLKEEMIVQVPVHLWSQHDTDVGLVKAATPVQIRLKPQAKPPRKPQ